MWWSLVLALGVFPATAHPVCESPSRHEIVMTGLRAISHTYEARIRIAGTVSKVQVQARDAGHAKKLLRAQYGSEVAILSVKRVD